MSDVTKLLQSLLNGEDIGNFEPKSRMEAYLKNCCLASGVGGLPDPITETDALLYQLAGKLGAGENDINAIIEGTVTEIHLQSAKKIKAGALSFCRSLTTADFPNVTSIDTAAFGYCTGLTTVNLPKVTKIGNSAFVYCRNLTTLDFVEAKKIYASAFDGCINLKTVILRNESFAVDLENSNAFHDTPFAFDGTGGNVYVPSDLVENYKIAAQWSNLYGNGTCNFLPIEGSEYE